MDLKEPYFRLMSLCLVSLCLLFSCIQLRQYKVGDKVVAIDVPGYDLFFQDGRLNEDSILDVLYGKVGDKSNVSVFITYLVCASSLPPSISSFQVSSERS